MGALLTALRSLLQDLLPTLNPGPELYRDIDNLIKPNITFLKQCRPLSISMQNAIRYLKRDIKSLDKDLTMDQARESIVEMIDDFININFVLYPKAISATANRKISDNDFILTFSLLNLVYDLTPATLVDSIITEISQIPPTSVPVVLRLHHLDMEEN